MLKYFNGYQKNFEKKLDTILNKRKMGNSKKLPVVKKIIADVLKNGDISVIKYEKKFNNLKITSNKNLKFNKTEMKNIIKKLDKKIKKSIDIAYNRIYRFHKKQKINKVQN